MSTAISIRLPNDLAKKLEKIAEQTERSRSFLVKKAVESYLEDYVDLQTALKRLRDKNDPTLSSKELRNALGL